MIGQKASTHKPESQINQTPSNYQKAGKVNLNLDATTVVTVIFMMVFGLLMVYSASWDFVIREGESIGYVLTRQLLWALLGSAIAIILSRIDYHLFKKFSLVIMAVMLIFLVLVLFIGEFRLGSTRAYYKGSIQPSELAKLVIIIYLSVWLDSKREQLSSIWFGLAPLILILGITSGLIFLEPDHSATATIFALGGLLFFLAGGDLRQITILVVVSALVGFILFTLTTTGSYRLTSYIEGRQLLTGANPHVQRSIEAVVRGDLFGVGIGKGQTKFTGLPFPWTDSIFAVIIEETGLLGVCFLITLYMVFLWRGLLIAHRAPDMLGRLLASGITLWIIMEALMNISGMINLMPFPGNALPLMSFGGSSLVTSLIGIGIILSVSYTTNKVKKNNDEGRKNGAVIDMRRRDGRRSVPRTIHPATRSE